MDLRVDLRLNGDRRVAGILKGYDQFLNVVLDEAIEIASTKKQGEGEQRQLGTIVIRGQAV